MYQTRVIDEYVLLGNAVVMKCLIPSFVADFVQVLGWVDDNGNAIGTTVGGIISRLKIFGIVANMNDINFPFHSESIFL